MASVVMLNSDLFNISWSPINSAAKNGQIAVTNLPDVFESCQLIYSVNIKRITLLLNFVLSKKIKSTKLEISLVLASKDGIKQKMILSKSKWTASWEAPAKSVNCRAGRNNTISSFEILIHLTPGSPVSVTKGAKHVLGHISNLWKTKTLSDVTFRCKGKDIEAHTFILASCSPVLAAMFTNDFKENREKVVDIHDMKPSTVSRLLKFMYIGDASLGTGIPEEEITELLFAADKYGVEALKEDCGLHLSRNLKVENAARFLVLAHLHNASILLESTFDFISKNSKAVCSRKDWLDVIKNYPELCFQTTQLMFGL